jgi:hypothetical protein
MDRQISVDAIEDEHVHRGLQTKTKADECPLIIYAAELAIAAIILFYVVEMLAMPTNMKRTCQGLIVLIAVLSLFGGLLGSAPPPASHVGPLAPNSPSNPSNIR